MRFKTALFALIVILTALANFSAGAGTALAQAGRPEQRDYRATEVPILTEVIIPESQIETTAQGFFRGKIGDLANYIELIYTWALSMVGLVAGSMMVVGGFQYLTAGGDKSRVQAARARITNAMIGMILAFSAYLLLNTINPGLVNFKFPAVAQVKTELALVPTCEDLAGTVTVTQLAGSACGNIGKFTTGGETHYCLYSGDCRGTRRKLKNQWYQRRVETGLCEPPGESEWTGIECFEKYDDNPLFATCMQSNVTQDQLAEASKVNPSKIYGQCLTCMQLVPYKVRELGFEPSDSVCGLWQEKFNSAPVDPYRNYHVTSGAETSVSILKKYPLGSAWSYCGFAEKTRTCVQADIYCDQADDDPDEGSCEGYEHTHFAHIPSERGVAKKDGETSFITTCGRCGITDSVGALVGNFAGNWEEVDDLQRFPFHLAGVCSWNPCRFNVDPNTPEYGANFGGCGYDKLVRVISIKGLRFKGAECKKGEPGVVIEQQK